jgi:hypothetical protein
LNGFQECPNALNCPGAGLAAPPEVENEARIAHDFTAEAGGRHVAALQEAFYDAEQMHGWCPL